MNTDTSFFRRKPYIAADPVSPLVAPITMKYQLIVAFFSIFRFTCQSRSIILRLSVVLSHKEVLKQVTQKLQGYILERKSWSMKQLQDV